MAELEAMIGILTAAFVWVVVGLWICYKREWYCCYDDNTLFCTFAVIGAPLNLLIVFIKVFCVDKWNNN
jgi:uncharacterized protein with PQ loop repeat